jgi:hypothetical protein
MGKIEKPIGDELIHLLRAYNDYPYSENQSHISKYLTNLNSVYEDIHPYLIKYFHEDKDITATQLVIDLPLWANEAAMVLAQVLDIKVIKTKILEPNKVEPQKVFILIGKHKHKQIYHILLKGAIHLYELKTKEWAKWIRRYNMYITYHKKRSPWLVRHEPLDGVSIMDSKKRHLRLKILAYFHELMQLRYRLDTQFIRSNSYMSFKFDVNTKIVEILGPRWRDRVKETKTLKYYFGDNYYKVQNRWINTRKLPTYWKRTEELRNALKNSKNPPIPKDLPPMPKHSRKPKGAKERWRPKSYRLGKTNL